MVKPARITWRASRRGRKLQYVDGSGNKVSLKLAGSGYMEQVRNASGEGVVSISSA